MRVCACACVCVCVCVCVRACVGACARGDLVRVLDLAVEERPLSELLLGQVLVANSHRDRLPAERRGIDRRPAPLGHSRGEEPHLLVKGV